MAIIVFESVAILALYFFFQGSWINVGLHLLLALMAVPSRVSRGSRGGKEGAETQLDKLANSKLVGRAPVPVPQTVKAKKACGTRPCGFTLAKCPDLFEPDPPPKQCEAATGHLSRFRGGVGHSA